MWKTLNRKIRNVFDNYDLISHVSQGLSQSTESKALNPFSDHSSAILKTQIAQCIESLLISWNLLEYLKFE